MEPELTIKLKIDRSQANAEVKAFASAEKQAEASVVAAVNAAEDAKLASVRRSVQDRIRDEQGRFRAVKEMLRSEATEATRSADAQKRAMDHVRSSMGQARDSLGDLAQKYVSLQVAAKVVDTLAESWRKVGENQSAAAKTALDYEKQSRELATLLGKSQPGQVVPDALNFALKTGLDARSADNFRRQFEGSLPSGLGKGNITPEVAKQLAIESGQMAARQGGDAGTRGDLAGILPQFGKVRSSEEGLGQLEAIRQALTEGRGDDTPLTQALLHVAGASVREKNGPVASLPELAAVVGTMSLSSGAGQADTRTEQLMRGLRGGTKEQQEFLSTTFGIQSKDTATGKRDTLESALGKLAPKLREIAVTQDPASYLTSQGVPEESARAMVEATENYDIFKQRLAKARDVGKGGAKVRADNEAFGRSALGRSMEADNRILAAEVNRGGPHKEFEAMTGLERAEQDVPEIKESVLQQYKDMFTGMKAGFLTPDKATQEGERLRLQQGVIDRLRKQAGGLGIDSDKLMESKGLAPTLFTVPNKEAQAKALSEAIRAKGADPYKAFDDSRVLDDVQGEMRRDELPNLPAARPVEMPDKTTDLGLRPDRRNRLAPLDGPPGATPAGAGPAVAVADMRELVGIMREVRDKLPGQRMGPPIRTRPDVDTRGIA